MLLLCLQACRPTLAARRSLAHEWKMFKDLSLLANDFQAARSHFLQVTGWCCSFSPVPAIVSCSQSVVAGAYWPW
jgi:hypothetical protein